MSGLQRGRCGASQVGLGDRRYNKCHVLEESYPIYQGEGIGEVSETLESVTGYAPLILRKSVQGSPAYAGTC